MTDGKKKIFPIQMNPARTWAYKSSVLSVGCHPIYLHRHDFWHESVRASYSRSAEQSLTNTASKYDPSVCLLGYTTLETENKRSETEKPSDMAVMEVQGLKLPGGLLTPGLCSCPRCFPTCLQTESNLAPNMMAGYLRDLHFSVFDLDRSYHLNQFFFSNVPSWELRD